MRFSWLYMGILFLLSAKIGQAQFIAHTTIYNEDNLPMTVYLDGEKKNNEPSSRVRIINLREPYYKLKIVFTDSTIEPVEKKMLLVQDSKGYPVDVIYVVKKNKKGFYGIHWKSQTIWPGYIQPPRQPKQALLPTPVKTCETATLDQPNFEQALKSIGDLQSVDAKMLLAKQLISTNCMETKQVKQLVQQFPEETQRLEIAIYAYAYTVDKGHYFQLNELFKNEKNIETLFQNISK